MSGIRKVLGAALFLALTLTASLAAAPALTPIQDTLYKANGTVFTGMATISWNSFVAADGTVIPQNTIAVPITAGALYVRLAPTAGLTGSPYYTVRFTANGKTQFTEVWVVPASPVAVKLSQVRVGSSAPATGAPSLLVIDDIDGLSDALGERPRKGSVFEFGRLVVVDGAGEITTVQGPASDCVRVDGSTGPCGSGGGSGGVPTFVDMQTPAGAADGSNVVFTLTNAPAPASSLHLYRNGILQRPGVDFSLNGSTVTFNAVSTPQSGDQIAASYRY